jgi:hypothetical protein
MIRVEMLGTEASRLEVGDTRWSVRDDEGLARIAYTHGAMFFRVLFGNESYVVDSIDFNDALTFAVMLLESEQ